MHVCMRNLFGIAYGVHLPLCHNQKKQTKKNDNNKLYQNYRNKNYNRYCKDKQHENINHPIN